MKNRSNPTEIVLKDLPLEGREFVYTRESGELNEALKDVISGNDFEAKFRLTPVGNAYSLVGSLKTVMDLDCSLCASGVHYPIQLKLNELIVVEKPMAKGDHQGRANHAHELQDGGPDYLILENETFRVPDYIHEAVALAEPIRPVCPPENAVECANALRDIQRDWLSVGEGEGKPIKANPFQVLEKMKLKD
jgi:uncharacterized metal-binding protein YceD (DUF177 family)